MPIYIYMGWRQQRIPKHGCREGVEQASIHRRVKITASTKYLPLKPTSHSLAFKLDGVFTKLPLWLSDQVQAALQPLHVRVSPPK